MSNSTARREIPVEQTSEQLRSEHRHLERRLEQLNTPRSLSPEEQAEIQRIKKRKLAIKDQLRKLESP